jgi:hypothetical protein
MNINVFHEYFESEATFSLHFSGYGTLKRTSYIWKEEKRREKKQNSLVGHEAHCFKSSVRS